MPLLVVPLAPDETTILTLGEWDRLIACDLVLFERPDHPLAPRLRDAGIAVNSFDDEPRADRDGWALVTDPDSPRVLELVRAGAMVTSGPAVLPDELTGAHGAYVGRRAAAELGTLAYVMARLRSSDGCPWDREQTHESLRVHLVEEAHEVLEAIDRDQLGAELEEELGDLLLQVAFHAQMAADGGRFDLAGVARRITSKLLHRHPHVFGETEVQDAAEVVRNWETIKAEEKDERGGPFDGIPASLSALLQAYKTQKAAAPSGFSPDEPEARGALSLALSESTDPTAVGDALFWLVALARSAGVDPEGALRSATARFTASLS
jgi:MazG family protein